MRVGKPEWEFGAIGEFAATAGLAVMGLTAVLAVSLYDRRRVVLVPLGVVSLGLAILGFMGLGVLAMDVPIVLGVASNVRPEYASGVKTVLAKSMVLLPLFSIGLFTIGLGAIRSFQRSR
jgi:hypothetical protein